MIVVDTNVIAYFLALSDQSLIAENVMKTDPDWAAPLLWRSEFRNVLLRYLRNNDLSVKDAVEKMDEAERIIGQNEYAVSSSRVIELAFASGCTAYDCEFVALAEQLRVKLITSDKKLLLAFPKSAISMAQFTI